MKKIVLVYGYYGIGGAQRRVANLADKLAELGYLVTIAAVYGDNRSIIGNGFYQREEKIPVVMIPDYFEENKGNRLVKNMLRKNNAVISILKKFKYLSFGINKWKAFLDRTIRQKTNSLQLKAYFAINEPDIVISFGFNIFERVFCAVDRRKQKVVFADTNSNQKYIKDKNYSDTIKLIEKADAAVFQTKQQEIDLSADNRHSYVIHNPIKDDLPERFTGERRKKIVNFCALKRHKNLLLLVKSFELLLQRNIKSNEYQLLLYCDNPQPDYNNKYRKEIVDYICKHNLEMRIKLLPMCADIHNKIIDSAMFVSSSDYEGISNSMIEAMAIGLPCVCTDCDGGGAREFIVDGYNGLLVEKGNEAALAFAMKLMLSDSKLSKKCSENAKKIRDELSIDNIIKQWIVVLNSLYGKQVEM